MSTPVNHQTREGVAIIDLADELQVYKQSVFKVLRRLGIQPTKRREAGKGNQVISVITPEEAALVRSEMISRRVVSDASPGAPTDDLGPLVAEHGYFYIIQLEPNHDPGRFKLGFTSDMEGRMRHHRCAAPYVICLKTWRCRRSWERAAIDCMTSSGVVQLHTEVFRSDSLTDIVRRGDQFFALMPSPDTVPVL